MKKLGNWKWIVLGYSIVALIGVVSVNRIEKLESAEDIATYNQVVAWNVL